MSFFASLLGTAAHQSHDDIILAVASKMPVLTGKAQMAQFTQAAEAAGQDAAVAAMTAHHDQDAVDEKVKSLAAMTAGIKNINAMLQSAQTDADKAKFQGAFDKVREDIVRLQSQIESLKARASKSVEYAESRKSMHRDMVSHLADQQAAIDDAARDIQYANEEDRRAVEREAQAKRDAHLTTSLDTNDAAITAMKAAAEKKRMHAQGLDATSDGLNGPASTDAVIKAAMASTSKPAPVDNDSFLASLK